MNLAHIHIVLNHLPTLGILAGLGLLAWALVTRNPTVERNSLVLLLVCGLLIVPTYLTGNAADGSIRSRDDIPRTLVEAHQDSAMLTLAFMTLTGTFAWLGLWQFRRFSRQTGWNAAAVMILTILTSGLILRTAGMGGEISHPEVRADGPIAEITGWRPAIEAMVSDYPWFWPAAETLHFIGMTLVFGVALAVSLRMLGVMKNVSFAALHRILPLGILGFVINLITGMLFFMAYPGLYYANWGFQVKIVAIVLAGANVIYFTTFDAPWDVDRNGRVPFAPKAMAVSVMVMILAVMYFGRMIPFFS
jgi:hypothetical protein